MKFNTPQEAARSLGLEFTTTATPDGKWLRFRFAFPGYDRVEVDTKTVAFRGVPKDYEAPASYLDAVRAVTRWRELVKPWLFVGTADTVAARLTIGSRISVGLWNRKNRKALALAAKALEASEAYGRQLAISQPTPQQGLRIIDELTKCAEPETQELRKRLVEAAQVADARMAEARAHATGTCGEQCPVCADERAAAQVVDLDSRRKAASA